MMLIHKSMIRYILIFAHPKTEEKLNCNLWLLLAQGDLNKKEYDLLKEVLYELERI